ncbi:MAG TPA: class I SAM-dependent methyltransferase [Solirubrobacterales bacterium]
MNTLTRPRPRRLLRGDYQRNYERICADHLAAFDQTGLNPFMDEDNWQMIEAETVTLIRKYARPGQSILDAGVGMGRILAQLPDLDRYGVDIAAGYLPFAEAAGIQVEHAAIEKLPYPSAHFDHVVCTDVLEHVIDLNACLWEILRVLKPAGLLFVRVPDREDLAPYLADEYPYRFVHLRSFAEPELRLLLDRVFGLEIVQTWVGGELSVVARKPRSIP